MPLLQRIMISAHVHLDGRITQPTAKFKQRSDNRIRFILSNGPATLSKTLPTLQLARKKCHWAQMARGNHLLNDPPQRIRGRVTTQKERLAHIGLMQHRTIPEADFQLFKAPLHLLCPENLIFGRCRCLRGHFRARRHLFFSHLLIPLTLLLSDIETLQQLPQRGGQLCIPAHI